MSDFEQTDLAALLSVLDRYSNLTVWVVGDLMLDEYVMGAVDRVSPEAPVPVVRVRETEHRLGGAANVARQIAALGAKVSLAGTIGTDAAGADLLRLCVNCGIDTRAVVRAAQRGTTRKLRVLGHSQQLLRMDWEDSSPCDASVCTQMLAALGAEAPDAVSSSRRFGVTVVAPR